MNKYLAGSRAVVWTGVKACIFPVAYDAFLSVYSGKIALYAPFLYPMCFFLGVVIELESIRKRGRHDGDHKRPPAGPADTPGPQ